MSQWTPTKFERVDLVDENQLDLFADANAATETEPRALTIQERFERFHAANPWVYRRLVDLARDLVRRGHHRVGIGMCWETLRYSAMWSSDPSSDFKLNDHYRSRYARLIVAQEPDLAEAFELRELRAS